MNKLQRRHTAVFAVLALSVVAPANASAQKMTATTECEVAAERYNAALPKIDQAIGAYTKCLSSSRGKDGCGSEFRKLRVAHEEFEQSVDGIRARCRR